MERFLEISPNTHHFTYCLHGEAESTVCTFKLVKVPTRNLHNHVIDGRLKVGRGSSCYGVGELVQVVPNGELGCHLGDRVSCSFGSQGRRARYQWVNFNTNDGLVVWAYRELYVTASGKIADAIHHRNGKVTHTLVNRIWKGHGRGYRNGVSCMHAHGVKIFDGADDNHVANIVAHHL